MPLVMQAMTIPTKEVSRPLLVLPTPFKTEPRTVIFAYQSSHFMSIPCLNEGMIT